MQSATAFDAIHDALSFFRNAYDAVRQLPRGADPPRRAGRRERARPARSASVTTRASADGARDGSRTSTCAPPTGSVWSSALDVRLDPGDSAGDHRAVGHRQDHAAAEPRRAVAVRVGQRAAARSTAARGDVRLAAALPPARRPARRRVLSPSPTARSTTTRDPAGPDQGGAAAPGHSDQRGQGLGQGAVGRRAAAHRVRPDPAEQAAGGVPRRVDLGDGRGPGVDAVPSCFGPSCPTRSWSA